MNKENKTWIKTYRKLLDSAVFQHERLLKLWILCLLKANYYESEIIMPSLITPIKLKPGQFITSRDSLHYDYHQGHLLEKKYRRKLKPVSKTLFRDLEKLSLLQNLSIKKTNKFSIVSINNWAKYQGTVQQLSNNLSNSCPQTRSIKKKKEITPGVFSSLRNRYSDQNLIDQIFKAIASTRKSNRVADSVLLTQLEKWKQYPVEQVETSFRIYLDKDYAGQGKDEKYLLGIIKNQKPETKRLNKESTGSPLLDAYYERNSG